MIIRVVPEKWYKEYIHAGEKLPVYQCPDSPFWKAGYFINIRNSRSIDPCRGIPLDGGNILKLQFDDVRELPAVRRIPFDQIMAERILDFIFGCDPSKPLFINCSAGISRSGAVGEVLNRFANTILTDNPVDFQLFYRDNPQLDPNPLVKEILGSVIESHLRKNEKGKAGIRALIFAFLILLFAGAAGCDARPLARQLPDRKIFRLTQQDEGRISREFLLEIIQAVGEDAASHASLELYYFWRKKSDSIRQADRQDWLIEYSNYLDRLYLQAYQNILQGKSAEEQEEFRKRELEWKNYSIPAASAEDERCHPGDDSYVIRVRTRTAYLESPLQKRQAADAVNTMKVPCGSFTALPIRHHYLERVTPDPDKPGRSYVERIAVIPPDFCHEVILGEDRFHLAILFPANEISAHGSSIAYERNLCVWKNGKFHGSYALPDGCTVLKTEVRGNEISVSYLKSSDETSAGSSRQIHKFTTDFVQGNHRPVKITNWLDHRQDLQKAIGRSEK